MANVLEMVSTTIKTLLNDDDKSQLHVGEVMSLWTYLASLEEAITIESIAKNTSTDKELLELVEEAIKLCSSQTERLKKFITDEGVPLPEASEPKPKSEPTAVPLGAKLTDYEIANMISIKFAGALVECAAALGESIRTDVGLIWTQFFAENAIYGSRLKAVMKSRGWIKTPPAFYPPGLSK